VSPAETASNQALRVAPLDTMVIRSSGRVARVDARRGVVLL
jgi:hypothetical protein